MPKQYLQYKQTTEGWMNAIPEHWQLLNVKALLRERKEKNSPIKTDFILSLSAKQGVVPYGEKKSGGNKAKEDISLYNLAQPNDLLVNCMNVVSGSSGISKYYGAISPVYYALYMRNELANISYLEYLFKLHTFYQSLVGLGNGIMMKQSSTGKLNTVRKRIPMTKLNKVSLPVPPRTEQDQIVRYLDWENTKINKFINAKRKEMRRLQELKKAVICSATMRGITSNVEMKDCSYPWVGQIPIAWIETRAKNVLVKLNHTVMPDNELLICSNKGKVFFRGEARIGLVSDSEDIYQGVRAGDLLIHGMDTWHGAIAVSDFDGKCTPVVHVCDSTQNKRYIAYYLQALAFKKVYKAISNGVRENTSDFRSWSKAGNILLVLPPTTNEQDEIATYLDEKCFSIEQLIAKLKTEIDFVEEYRKRLISDVVTGKVDVRDIETPDLEIAATDDAEIDEVLDDEDLGEDIEIEEDEVLEVTEDGDN